MEKLFYTLVMLAGAFAIAACGDERTYLDTRISGDQELAAKAESIAAKLGSKQSVPEIQRMLAKAGCTRISVNKVEPDSGFVSISADCRG